MISLVTALALLQMHITGLKFVSFWAAGWLLLWQLLAFFGWGCVNLEKPVLRCFVEANVATTFVFLALGIVQNDSEGGDYLNSRINILWSLGRCLLSFIHIRSLLRFFTESESNTGNYKVKTCF